MVGSHKIDVDRKMMDRQHYFTWYPRHVLCQLLVRYTILAYWVIS